MKSSGSRKLDPFIISNTCEQVNDVIPKQQAKVRVRGLGLPSILDSAIICLLIPTIFVTFVYSQSPTVIGRRCQPTDSLFCNIENYTTVEPFKNTLGHTSLESAGSDLDKYAFFLASDCQIKMQLFLCSLFFPVCTDLPDTFSQPVLPCREVCEVARTCEPDLARALNISWPRQWDCVNFDYFDSDQRSCFMNQNFGIHLKSERDFPGKQDKSSNQTGRWVESHRFKADDQFRKPSTTSSPIAGFLSDHSDGLNRSGNPLSQPVHHEYAFPRMDQEQDTVNPSTCENGFFDCQFSDPKSPLCIELKYVCDGKRDCMRNDSIFEVNEGLDETNCPRRLCAEGQIYCDEKCILRQEICDGKADCSSAADEHDCYDSMSDLIQYVICLFLISSAIFMIVRYLSSDDESAENSPVHCVNECGKSHADLNASDDQSPVTIPHEFKHHKPLNKIFSPLGGEIVLPEQRSPFLNTLSVADIPEEDFFQDEPIRNDAIYNYDLVLPRGNPRPSPIYASRPGGDLVAPPPTRTATPIYQNPTRSDQSSHLEGSD